MDSMGIKVELPMVMKVDNVGAIFLGNNFSVGQRTKRIDICAHVVREYIDEELIKLVFVCSEYDDSDYLTKNTPEELDKKHSSKMTEIVPSQFGAM